MFSIRNAGILSMIVSILWSGHLLAQENKEKNEKKKEAQIQEQSLHFGLYRADDKIGYASMEVTKRKNGKYVWVWKLSMQCDYFGTKKGLTDHIYGEKEYANKYPFHLLAYKFDSKFGKKRKIIKMRKTGSKIIADFKSNGYEYQKESDEISYTMMDQMACELWVRKNPNIGEEMVSKSFVIENFRTGKTKNTIIKKTQEIVYGIPTELFSISTRIGDSRISNIITLSREGVNLSFGLGRSIEARWEPFEISRDLANKRESLLYDYIRVGGTLKLDKKPEEELNLEVPAEFAKALPVNETQSLRKSGNRHILGLKQKKRPRSEKGKNGIEEYLSVTSEFPAKHPRIRSIIEKTIEPALTAGEKIARLLKYVSNHFSKSITIDLDLMNAVDLKKGDCTEHTDLFISLARAAGIPARRVVGLKYTGDEVKTYSYYTWCEMLVGDSWVQVDPTSGEDSVERSSIVLSYDHGEELYNDLVFKAKRMVLFPWLEKEEDSLVEDRVIKAVENYFSEGEARAEARAVLRELGERALPGLRKLAESPHPETLDWEIVCAIKDLSSQAAFDLFVDILDGKTRVERRHALSGLTTVRIRGFLLLLKNPRFKPAVFSFAGSSSWYQRVRFADLAAKLDWKDAAPLLRKMAADDNVSLRTAAAEALKTLTGEVVPVKRPTLTFPGKQIVHDTIVKTPIELSTLFSSKYRFRSSFCYTKWFDGEPVFVCRKGTSFTAFGENYRECGTLHLDAPGGKLIGIPGHERKDRALVLVPGRRFGEWSGSAICISKEGEELWRYQPPGNWITASCPLYDSEGIYGVAFGTGGKGGIVALENSGKMSWRWKGSPTLLRTHRSLPKLLLSVGPVPELLEHGVGTVRLRWPEPGQDMKSRKALFARHGLLFPAESGEPVILLAGTSKNSVPVIMQLNSEGFVQWKATLPHDIEGLSMLDPGKYERFFVTVTRGGSILVFNEKGVIWWEGKLPGAGSARHTTYYSLVAGEMGKGSWFFAVTGFMGTYIYRLNR